MFFVRRGLLRPGPRQKAGPRPGGKPTTAGKSSCSVRSYSFTIDPALTWGIRASPGEPSELGGFFPPPDAVHREPLPHPKYIGNGAQNLYWNFVVARGAIPRRSRKGILARHTCSQGGFRRYSICYFRYSGRGGGPSVRYLRVFAAQSARL